MPITIGSNIQALRAQGQLRKSTERMMTSYQRLSSGQRINRASDDAAGLAVKSELDVNQRLASQAVRNVNDVVSMLSVMQGALQAQKEILFRLTELAQQSANGTYSDNQRAVLQQEYASMMDEFDRVAEAATFNGVSLLRNKEKNTISAMAGITGADESLLEIATANSHRFSGIYAQEIDFDNVAGGSNTVDASDFGDILESLNGTGTGGRGEYIDYALVDVVDSEGIEGQVRFLLSPLFEQINSFNFPGFGTNYTIGGANPTHDHNDLFISAIRSDGDSYYDNAVDVSLTADSLEVSFAWDTSGATVSFSIDLSDIDYQLVDWQDSGADKDIAATVIGFTNVENRYSAARAVDILSNRIDSLSQLQGELGSVESRLEISSQLLQSQKEAFSAASAQIGDTDIAAESSRLVRESILQQASSAVLAQANLQPELALELLR